MLLKWYSAREKCDYVPGFDENYKTFIANEPPKLLFIESDSPCESTNKRVKVRNRSLCVVRSFNTGSLCTFVEEVLLLGRSYWREFA
jgi:hypothetical protein